MPGIRPEVLDPLLATVEEKAKALGASNGDVLAALITATVRHAHRMGWESKRLLGAIFASWAACVEGVEGPLPDGKEDG